MKLNARQFKTTTNIVSLILCVFVDIASACPTIGYKIETMNNMNNETLSKSKIQEETVQILIRHYPLDEFDLLLNNIWDMTNSADEQQKEIAWEALSTLWKFSDGMKCHFFTRFCWFISKSEPLSFYVRYLKGDETAIQYYILASMYDIWTFKRDKITHTEFLSVIEHVITSIENYNKENSIKENDDIILLVENLRTILGK